jgi:hypothetical protein
VVQPFPNPTSKSPVSTNGGAQPRWRADGKALYFIAPDRTLMAAPIAASVSTLEAGKPAALFPTRIMVGSGAAFRPQHAISRDGRFLISQPVEESTATPITLILNWNPEKN